MDDNIYNKEHYLDTTAYYAINNIEKERLSKMIREVKEIIYKYDYELVARIQVRDKSTGKIYK